MYCTIIVWNEVIYKSITFFIPLDVQLPKNVIITNIREFFDYAKKRRLGGTCGNTAFTWPNADWAFVNFFILFYSCKHQSSIFLLCGSNSKVSNQNLKIQLVGLLDTNFPQHNLFKSKRENRWLKESIVIKKQLLTK